MLVVLVSTTKSLDQKADVFDRVAFALSNVIEGTGPGGVHRKCVGSKDDRHVSASNLSIRSQQCWFIEIFGPLDSDGAALVCSYEREVVDSVANRTSGAIRENRSIGSLAAVASAP